MGKFPQQKDCNRSVHCDAWGKKRQKGGGKKKRKTSADHSSATRMLYVVDGMIDDGKLDKKRRGNLKNSLGGGGDKMKRCKRHSRRSCKKKEKVRLRHSGRVCKKKNKAEHGRSPGGGK